MAYDVSPGAVYQHFMNLHGPGATPHFTSQQLIAWLDNAAPNWREENYAPDGVTGAGSYKTMDDLLRKAMVESQAAGNAYAGRPRCENCHQILKDATMKAVLQYLNNGDALDAELKIASLGKYAAPAGFFGPPLLPGESASSYTSRTGRSSSEAKPAKLVDETDEAYLKRTGTKTVAPAASKPLQLPGETNEAYAARTKDWVAPTHTVAPAGDNTGGGISSGPVHGAAPQNQPAPATSPDASKSTPPWPNPTPYTAP